MFCRTPHRAFTIIELLIVIGIVALLIGIFAPVVSHARNAAKRLECVSRMRQIGIASTQHAVQRSGAFPRSSHSASSVGEVAWGRALMPYLGFVDDSGGPNWKKLFNTLYRCPTDRRTGSTWSYGKNVYLELNASETGGRTFTRLSQVPRPSVTVMFAELRTSPGADHFMAHFWADGGTPEVDLKRHGSFQNYIFVDGHVETLRFDQTYAPGVAIDRWNPLTAN